MFTENEITKFLFFDVETAAEKETLDALRKENEKKASLWDKRTEYLRDRYPENVTLSNDELYAMKAGLHAEYLKVICVSFGYIREDGKISTKSFYGDDERDILEKSFNLIDKFGHNIGARFRLAGHNIKEFDIPVLAKRGIIHRLDSPEVLKVHNKKPWEFMIEDTQSLWSHGVWQQSFVSLDLLCEILDIPSPKTGLAGDQVHAAYYAGKIKEITEYCEGDVVSTINVLRKFCLLDPITEVHKNK